MLDFAADFEKSFDLLLVMEAADSGVQTAIEVDAVPVEQFNFLFIPGLLLAEQTTPISGHGAQSGARFWGGMQRAEGVDGEVKAVTGLVLDLWV